MSQLHIFITFRVIFWALVSALHELSHLIFTATLWSRFDDLSFGKGELGLGELTKFAGNHKINR